VLVAWSQFLLCAGLIAAAGFALARYGDVIAAKTGLGGTWIGVILVATVTSLPELVTGLASVTVANAPDIAVGDVLGSCVFNLLLIAVLDFLYRESPLYTRASQGHILAAAFSVMLIGLATFSLLTAGTVPLRLWHIGIYTPAILVLYLVAVRAIYTHERMTAATAPETAAADAHSGITLRQAAIRYAAAGALVVAAGIAMPFAAVRLAEVMGWGQSFVGTLLVAGATSLPEAASTIGALRLRAFDLAIGNLLGSNLFNILILALDDIAYLKGPLLWNVSPAHAVSGVSALIMTGAAIVGLFYRPAAGRLFRTVGWVSLAIVLAYVFNTLVLYLRGH
jgi:cation:H+ antiporter